jgi:RND family efflux transporter MFP subunit
MNQTNALSPATLITLSITLAALALLIIDPGNATLAQADRTTRSATPDLSRYTAVARPLQEVVIAAGQDGLITGIEVEAGDPVAAGDLMVQMDDRVQKAVVALAEKQATNDAPVQVAREQVRLQQTELDNLESLATTSAATQREIQVARVRLAQAQAQLRDAEAQIDQLRAQLELETQRLATLSMTAPFRGVVLERMVAPGSVLRTADPVLRIAQLDTLETRLPLPAELFDTLVPGKTYLVAAGPPLDRPLEATLIRVSPEIDAASDTFLATFHIDNADLELPAGFRVHLGEIVE